MFYINLIITVNGLFFNNSNAEFYYFCEIYTKMCCFRQERKCILILLGERLNEFVF